jgi:hypothetical protein
VLRPVTFDGRDREVDDGLELDAHREMERNDDLRRARGGLALKLVLAGCAVRTILLIWLN